MGAGFFRSESGRTRSPMQMSAWAQTVSLSRSLVLIVVILRREISETVRVISIEPLYLVIPAKARDYVFTGVGLSACLFVCYHDN